jgi:hypothetical protein
MRLWVYDNEWGEFYVPDCLDRTCGISTVHAHQNLRVIHKLRIICELVENVLFFFIDHFMDRTEQAWQ